MFRKRGCFFSYALTLALPAIGGWLPTAGAAMPDLPTIEGPMTVTGAAGNSSPASANVFVPHNAGKD